jgi:putative ATP-dependent endonuclease of OLD family
MVDDEGKYPTRWARIKEVLGDLLIQWPDGCLEQQVIPMFEPDVLPSLIEDPQGILSGRRRRSLAERLDIEVTDIESIKEAAGDGLRQLIVDAAKGTVPERLANAEQGIKKHFRAHAGDWFKSKEGGRELAEKVFALGAWPKLQPIVLPFLNAVRQPIELDPIEGLPA